MKYLFSCSFLLVVICCVYSCEIDRGPDIEIISPSDGDRFDKSEVMNLRVEVTDDIDLESIEINLGNGQVLEITGLDDDDDDDVDINENINVGTMEGTFTIKVTAVDSDDFEAEKTVDIIVE